MLMNDIADEGQRPADSKLVPRFADIATFMRLPIVRDPKEIEHWHEIKPL